MSLARFQRRALTHSKQVASRKLGEHFKSTGAFKLLACIEGQLLKNLDSEKNLVQVVLARQTFRPCECLVSRDRVPPMSNLVILRENTLF